MMNKKLLTLLGASLLILTACGGGSTEGTDVANGENQELVEVGGSDVSGAVGGDLDLGDGVTLKLSEPQNFTPGIFASNYVKGQTANLFEATITNGGSNALDWATVSFVTTTTGAGACPEVLDGDNGVNGQPMGTLAAGSSETFKFGVACDTKPGAELNVAISVGGKIAEVKGKLA
jgi:hypothetical protein